MNRNQFFGILGFLLYFCCYVCATLKINQIIGPDSVVDGSLDELVLDCDFDAEGEEEVVVKWFFNGLEVQIYQWITSAEHAYASGPWKDLIDTSYRVSQDPTTMLRALKFKEVSPALSGNYTCKVSSEASDVFRTKQVIVYSPPRSFDIILMGEDDENKGNEIVLCWGWDVSPKPTLDLYVAGMNGSLTDLPETFALTKEESGNSFFGSYNVSITLPFNSSYLEDGTTRFVCQISIPGTNYSESKSVEFVVEFENESAELLYGEDYPNLNATLFPNSTDETAIGDNGKFRFRSSLFTVVLLLFSLVLAT